MQWLTLLSDLFGLRPASPPPSDSDSFTRRERDLQARLNRLTQEVDVIQRTDTSEEHRE
jgi:hypothetical protein